MFMVPMSVEFAMLAICCCAGIWVRVTSPPKRLRAGGALWQGILVSRLLRSRSVFSGADAGVVASYNTLQATRGVCVAQGRLGSRRKTC